MELFHIIFIGVIIVMAAILLAVKHNKSDQNKIMNYYKETYEEGSDVARQSIENQKKMIELLEDISKKLDK